MPNASHHAEEIYYVLSPEYETYTPILDDGSGPSEWGVDFAEVRAETKAEARRLGYIQLKVQPWFREHYDHDKHPYAYLTVVRQADLGESFE